MIRRPPRSTLDRSSAASDVYKRQTHDGVGTVVTRESLENIREAKPDDIAALIALIEPVSYTHLRAHETVLDLVCRLLLEKKQETQTNHSSTYHSAENGLGYVHHRTIYIEKQCV